MIKKIIFEIETITPMFLAGADQSKAELRPASIKGLLRWWWRASQAESNLERLKEKENKIFGSAAEGEGGGSSFSVRIAHDGVLNSVKSKFPDPPTYRVPVEGKNFKINILEYIAYGTYEYKKGDGNVFTREYFPPGVKFSVIIIFYKENYINEVLQALYVFSLFGGIGSRCRNGFGSFDILNKADAFQDIKDYLSIDKPYEIQNLRKLVKPVDRTSYSSFAKLVKIFRTKDTFNSAYDSLAAVGKIYKNARSKLELRHQFEERQYIGAPIVEKKITRSFLERHAKPYFMKITKEGSKYRSYALYLPSEYCRGKEKDDKNKNPINHSSVDKKFGEVCDRFNNFLSADMETIL